MILRIDKNSNFTHKGGGKKTPASGKKEASPETLPSIPQMALERVRQDINWMLNNQRFLNPETFDYLDKAIEELEASSVPEAPESDSGTRVSDEAELMAALTEIIEQCPNPKLPYGRAVVEIARNALAANQARKHLRRTS